MTKTILDRARRIEYEKKIADITAKLIKKNTGKGPRNIKVKIIKDFIDIMVLEYLTEIEKCALKDSENTSVVEHLREIFDEVYKKNLSYEISNIMNQKVELIQISRDLSKDKTIFKFIIR